MEVYVDPKKQTGGKLTSKIASEYGLPDYLKNIDKTNLSNSDEIFRFLLERNEIDFYDRLTQKLDKIKANFLALEKNWDGEGAIEFQQQTLNDVKTFLLYFYSTLFTNKMYLDLPMISPDIDGSIDLHWQGESLDFLINIQQDTNLVSISGDFENERFETDLNINTSFEVVLNWLKSILT